MSDMMKIVQALEDQGILLNGVTKKVENEVKSQHGGAFGMILGTLAVSLLGNLLSGKGLYRAGENENECNCVKKKRDYWGEGVYRTGYGNKEQIKKKL